jgi:CRP-like cAMP-binding protein
MLDATQWASKFSWQEILAITANMRAFQISKGATLFREGETDQYMGIIVKGTVEIVKSDLQKGTNCIATLSKSHSLGEMGILDNEPRSANATAKTDVLMLVMRAADIQKLQNNNPSVGFKLVWKIAQMLSQRLRRTSGQLVDYMN